MASSAMGGVGRGWGGGVHMTPCPKNSKLNLKKNEVKEHYVDYLFNNTSLKLCFAEEQNSIFMQQGEEI